MLIGPRGMNQKRLESESGYIFFRFFLADPYLHLRVSVSVSVSVWLLALH